MRHLHASQRRADGRWDYAETARGTTRAIGYCAGWHEIDLEAATALLGQEGGWLLKRDLDAERHRMDRYHDGGHPTEGEACACYRRYLLDRARFGGMEMRLEECEMEGCGAPTKGGAQVDWRVVALCPSHQNPESLEALFPEVGESWTY